jgi:flagellar biosynthetic protein FliQ
MGLKMNQDQIIDLTHRAMYIAALLGIPVLAICLIVGLVIAVFETATQIHEQALAFVPKVVAVILFLAIMGNWMVGQLESFTREVFSKIANM